MNNRTLYVTYSIRTRDGVGNGRNTVDFSAPPGPIMLGMTEIRDIEKGLLRAARETYPEIIALHLTWWAEIRPEAPSLT